VRLVERLANGGISAATNSAIAEAKGDWVVFMDHDDTLAPYALFRVAVAVNDRPSAALLYSDEDKIDEDGLAFMPYFKSDFDPLLLLGQNYVCHLTTVRRSLLEELGGLRSEFDGSQDWDLVLRVAETVPRQDIVHLPYVLYHWRSHAESTSRASAAKPWALEAGRRAVEAALARRGVRADVAEVETTGFAEVRFALPDQPPLVSVLIPTRDGIYLAQCLTSLLERTTYPNYEVVVIDNGSVDPSTAATLASWGPRLRVLRDDSAFNYSALHNRAVAQCDGQVLLLLNDDTEILDGTWMEAMVAQLLQPGVGAVGAKLLYGDGRVQHAGVILGPEGLATQGYFGRTALASEFQACTAACLAVRRDSWDALGGLDETLRVAWNDIDFCLRLRERGETVTYTPRATLVHYESVSRGHDQSGAKFARFMEEVGVMRDRWGAEIAADPYYNPNLALNHGAFELAYPPRVSPFYTGIE
jgi:GT2 family glycosyltransferase